MMKKLWIVSLAAGVICLIGATCADAARREQLSVTELTVDDIILADDLAVGGDGTVGGNLDVTGSVTSGSLVVKSSSTLPVHDVALEELPAMTTGQILVGDSSDSNANVVVASGVTFDASGAATVAASALSGHIAADQLPAMTTGQILVGDTSDSNANVVTMSGDVTIDATGNATVTADIPRNTDIRGSCAIAVGDLASGQLISTNTITIKDIAGNSKTGYALIRVWVSESAPYGPASTNNIEALTLSGGSVVATETANADYWYVTKSDGTAVVTITATACLTNYLNVAVGENVTALAIELVP